MAAGAGGFTIYDWNLRTGEFTVTDYAELLGSAAEEAILTRRSWKDLLHPDDRGKVSEIFPQNGKESLTIETEYRILTKSGSYRWFMDRGRVVEWNDRREPCRVSGILVDISDRKAGEEASEKRTVEALAALQKSEDEKWAILVALRDLVSVHYLDPRLRIVWTNRDLFEDLKIKPQAAFADYCHKMLHGRTEPCVPCAAVKALETSELQEIESRLDDGRFFIRRGNPVKDSAGAVLGVMQIALNVTKHKQTEEGLKSTYQFLYSLLENSPTPILVTRRDGRIDIVNKAWEKIIGFKREETTGHYLHDVFPAEVANRFNRINKKVVQSGVPLELEESIDCPTGSHNFYTVSFPIQDASGQGAAIGSIWLDITARKLAERELAKREAELARKSRQLGEMNTALRVLLRQRDEDQKELEERIVSNVKELILPYIHQLKKMHLNEAQISNLEIVETHLNDIVTPFLRQIVSHYPHMTAKELQVAVLVKEGKANKLIAELMNVSVNAVEIHRYNLRKKLGLQNKKINLRSYLLSLNKLQ